jgi:hypothetical protein
MGDSVTTVEKVSRYLPDNLPTDVNSAAISEAMEMVHGYVVTKLRPASPSASNELDVLIETLLSAVEVRDTIPGLSDAFGSRTKAIHERAEGLLEDRIDEQAGGDDFNPLPIGAGGRAGESKDVHPIFPLPRPDSDPNDDVEVEDQVRPGNLS